MAFSVDNSATIFPGYVTQFLRGAVQRLAKDEPFPGLSGAWRLVMDGATRRFLHEGVLIGNGTSRANAIADLEGHVDVIEGLSSGSTALCVGEHTVITEDGRTYTHMTLDPGSFVALGPIRTTGAATTWQARQNYRCTWTQLQPVKDA